MAWRSGGKTNDEMVDNLRRFQVIKNSEVEGGFRNVDRLYFVPPGNEDDAHSDQPLKEGNIHISAPHIYGSVLEALELHPDSSQSFLNIGFGTGYVSCIIASILGHRSSIYGVEIHEDVIEHSQKAIARWKSTYNRKLPPIHVIHGNGLNITFDEGEAAIGFDRIYVGAAISRDHLEKVRHLLKPGGILIAPAEDELVKVANTSCTLADESSAASNSFSEEILSGVRFAPLLSHPPTPTLLRSKVWAPSDHLHYPCSFQAASKMLLLCSNADYVQPPPRKLAPKKRVNFAAMLPVALWMEVLTFTHRNWFEPETTTETVLLQRLGEEQEKVRLANEACREVQAQLAAVQRDRDTYRVLARQWQQRLQSLTQIRRNKSSASSRRASVVDTGVASEHATASPLGAMLRGFGTGTRRRVTQSYSTHSTSQSSNGDEEEAEPSLDGLPVDDETGSDSDQNLSWANLDEESVPGFEGSNVSDQTLTLNCDPAPVYQNGSRSVRLVSFSDL